MDFSRHLWIPAVLVVGLLLGCLCCFVTGEEVCYRGDGHIEYDNPCADESGEPAKLDLCSRGRRLIGRCKASHCEYCDEGTYQDTFTNCSTCLPCTTAADCPPGQVLISVCEGDRNAVCGCPPPPPCPTCESCPTAPPCPSVTPCPVQTECPACECPTNAPVTTGSQEATKLTLIGECPADILEGPLSGSETKTVHWKEPQATDGATVEQSHHPGDRFFAGNTKVIYVFKTEEHVIVCSFVVTVTEEIFVPTTPSRRDETTENNTPESVSQVGSDFDTCWICWILLVVLGVLYLILILCFILKCCKKNPKKGPAQQDPATTIVNVQGPPNGQLQPPIQANPAGVPQGECVQLDPLRQIVPLPGNNNLPANDGEGVEDGSAASSDAGSNRDAGRLNSPDQHPNSDLNSDLEPISGAAVYSGARGGTGETDHDSGIPLLPQPHSLSSAVEPAQNNRTAPIPSQSCSPSSSVEPQHRELSRMQSDQPGNSATPLLSQLHSLSSSAVESVQNPGLSRMQSDHLSHPEELITMEDRRGSEVTEMELRWLAKIVYTDGRYLKKRRSLYGYLDIKASAIPRIKHEHMSNNFDNDLETEIFTIIYYGRLEGDNQTEEEDSRGHLIKQLYTFDRKLAEAYAEYINNCENFSIMGPV